MIRLLDANRDEIPLSLPETHGGMPVAEALAHRRSHREFAAQRPTASHVTQLFWAAQGIKDGEQEHRTAPLAGALLPIMIFVIDHSGVCQYEPRMHRLHRVHDRDVRANLQTAALDQSCVGSAPVCLVVALDCARSVSKYGRQAERRCLLEAGHVAQNASSGDHQRAGGGSGRNLRGRESGQHLEAAAEPPPVHLVPLGAPRSP